MSEFRAVVKIIRYKCSGGFGRVIDGEAKPVESATMEMEGSIFVCTIGSFKKGYGEKKKTHVHMNIEFSQHQETSFNYENEEKSYIGSIQLFQPEQPGQAEAYEGAEIVANIELNLPLTMIPRLLPLKGERIIFESIGNTIEKSIDGKVYVMKKVSFDVAFDTTEKPKGKWFNWS